MIKRVLCALLALILVFGCAACGASEPAPTTEATTEPTTEPTTVPTTEATEPPTTEPTEPPLVLHSGLREDGTFSEGALLIGDSLTCGFVGSFLSKKGYLGDAKYMTICGSKASAFFDGTIFRSDNPNMYSLYSPEFDGKEFDDATAELGEDLTAIYLMWGTNYMPNGSKQDYIDIIDYLLEHCPNATIHLQLVPYADLALIPYPTINKRIRAAYAHYEELGEPRVFLVDTYMGIGRDVVADGVHIGMVGYGNWYKTLLKHAETNQLSE